MKKLLFFAPFTIAMLIMPCLVSAQTPQPNQASMSELDTALARAEEARKKAGDFESSSYFPGEWEAAEANYANADRTKIPADYHAAADAFDSVFKLTIPLYAQAREDEIMALRNSLVAAGARVSFPEVFAFADKTALSALEQYEAQDYYTARDSAAQALLMYQAMTSAHNAWLLHQEIVERDFAHHDPENFEYADAILNDAINAYRAGNLSLARENADEAQQRYNLVLSAGWAAYADLRSSLAETERQAALDIKAHVAIKDLFTEADSVYRMAVDLFSSESYEEAAKQFINAETLFIAASTSAAEKRNRAAEVIREAHEKIKKSDETARQAEIAIKGRSK